LREGGTTLKTRGCKSLDISKIWRRWWDSNPTGFFRFCNLQILNCRRCRKCQRCPAQAVDGPPPIARIRATPHDDRPRHWTATRPQKGERLGRKLRGLLRGLRGRGPTDHGRQSRVPHLQRLRRRGGNVEREVLRPPDYEKPIAAVADVLERKLAARVAPAKIGWLLEHQFEPGRACQSQD
jgi:hypothetical protein